MYFWLFDLHLVRLDGGGSHSSVHPGGLEGPPAARLVKERPPDRDWDVEEEDGEQLQGEARHFVRRLEQHLYLKWTH